MLGKQSCERFLLRKMRQLRQLERGGELWVFLTHYYKTQAQRNLVILVLEGSRHRNRIDTHYTKARYGIFFILETIATPKYNTADSW